MTGKVTLAQLRAEAERGERASPSTDAIKALCQTVAIDRVLCPRCKP